MKPTLLFGFFILLNLSCQSTKKLYELDDGQVVGCEVEIISACGVTLRKCDDGVDVLCTTHLRTYDP